MDLNRPMAVLDAELEAFRLRSDELADGAVAALLAAKKRGPDLVGAVEACAREGSRACADLLDHAWSVPGWVDFKAMRCGAQLGLKTPLQSALALLLGSLVESYGSAKGAKVLIRGGMLEKQVLQRLQDTTGFLIHVAASRGPRPGSPGHRHVLRTRIVHGFVRHGMLARGDWDFAWGHPVNQEDYASTLLAFSHVYLRSMARLGTAPSEEEERSVHHLYRWVGQVMGVAPELLSATRDEERRLYVVLTRRQLHPDDDSRRLTTALLDTLGGRAPFYLPRPALAALTRHLHGEAMADALGLPPAGPWRQVPAALGALGVTYRLADRVPLASFAMEHLGERISRLIHARALKPPPRGEAAPRG